MQVIAASAMVIEEARQLLEMAEPAWNYASYHTIWRLMADEYELDTRLGALEMKVRGCLCFFWCVSGMGACVCVWRGKGGVDGGGGTV